MSQREPIETTNLDTTFGSEPIPWSRPLGLLSAGPFGMDTTFVLGTIRPDGRPHAAMFGAAFYDGDMYFQTGRRTVKARNLAANPACTIAASIPGMDLVFEGEAQRVTDPATLEAVVAIWREGGWPAQVEGDGLSAPYGPPGGGPPPWHLYRLQAHTVIGIAGAEPHGATRWRF